MNIRCLLFGHDVECFEFEYCTRCGKSCEFRVGDEPFFTLYERVGLLSWLYDKFWAMIPRKIRCETCGRLVRIGYIDKDPFEWKPEFCSKKCESGWVPF